MPPVFVASDLMQRVGPTARTRHRVSSPLASHLLAQRQPVAKNLNRWPPGALARLLLSPAGGACSCRWA